jgi:Sec7-like guanine-nucleotide exchange factor
MNILFNVLGYFYTSEKVNPVKLMDENHNSDAVQNLNVPNKKELLEKRQKVIGLV